jgi:hypothetical protein
VLDGGEQRLVIKEGKTLVVFVVALLATCVLLETGIADEPSMNENTRRPRLMPCEVEMNETILLDYKELKRERERD